MTRSAFPGTIRPVQTKPDPARTKKENSEMANKVSEKMIQAIFGPATSEFEKGDKVVLPDWS